MAQPPARPPILTPATALQQALHNFRVTPSRNSSLGILVGIYVSCTLLALGGSMVGYSVLLATQYHPHTPPPYTLIVSAIGSAIFGVVCWVLSAIIMVVQGFNLAANARKFLRDRRRHINWLLALTFVGFVAVSNAIGVAIKGGSENKWEAVTFGTLGAMMLSVTMFCVGVILDLFGVGQLPQAPQPAGVNNAGAGNLTHWSIRQLFFISLFQYILAVGLTTGMSALGWRVLRPEELTLEDTLMFAGVGSVALGVVSWAILTLIVYKFNCPRNGDYWFIYYWFCRFQIFLFVFFVMASNIVGFYTMKLHVHLPIGYPPTQVGIVLSVSCVGSVISIVLMYILFGFFYPWANLTKACLERGRLRLERDELLLDRDELLLERDELQRQVRDYMQRDQQQKQQIQRLQQNPVPTHQRQAHPSSRIGGWVQTQRQQQQNSGYGSPGIEMQTFLQLSSSAIGSQSPQI